MTHAVSSLVKNTKGKTGEPVTVCENTDWDHSLNEYAKDGWILKNSGTVVASNDIIFWALLEKSEKQLEI